MKMPTRAWLVLLAISIGLIALGQSLGHRDGLLLSVALALSINGLLFFYGDIRLAPLLEVQEIEGQDPWGLLEQVRTLSDRARIKTPRVFLIPSSSPQSLVIGRSIKNGKIFLTEGLLERLTPEELRAILCFHVACIKNLSTLSFTVGSALADAVLVVGRAFDKIVRAIMGRHPGPITSSMGTWLVAPLAASLIHITVNKRDYLAADALAAKLVGDPKILATALWKLHSYSFTRPFSAPAAAAPFFVVNPLTRRGWNRYFHAQPSTRERILRLIGYYPL